MTTRERLIWERDHSDDLGEWERYDLLLRQLEAGLLSPSEAARLAGLEVFPAWAW